MPPSTAHSSTQLSSPRYGSLLRSLRAVGLVVLIALVLQWAAVLGGASAGPKDFDEPTFHIPVIRGFMAQWPAPDLSDYPAATAPGYHLLMAAALAPFGPGVLDDHIVAVRLFSGLFTVALAAIVAGFIAARIRVADAVLLTMPVLVGQYVFTSTMRLMPEGLAWCTVAAVLAVGLSRMCWKRGAVLAGLLVLGAVGVRQSNIWLAAVPWMIAWLATAPWIAVPARRLVPARETWALPTRAGRLTIGVAATLPAFILLAVFAILWGGLVPPTFQDASASEAIGGATGHAGLNPAVPAAVLMTLGVYGLPAVLAVALGPAVGLRAMFAPSLLKPALLGAFVGLLVAIIPPTSYSMDAGRWGSLWNLARLIPPVLDRAPLVVLASICGGAVVAVLFSRADARSRWILLGTLVAFTAAQTANTQAWIRYIEPMALLWLAFAAAQGMQTRHIQAGPAGPPPSLRPLARIAVLGLIALLVTQTVLFRLMSSRGHEVGLEPAAVSDHSE